MPAANKPAANKPATKPSANKTAMPPNLVSPATQAEDDMFCILCKQELPHETNTQAILDAIRALQDPNLAGHAAAAAAALLLARSSTGGAPGGAVAKLLASSACIEALLASIKAAPADVAAHAAEALASIAFRGRESQLAIFRAGAVAALVPLLGRGETSEPAAKAARALHAVVGDIPAAQDEMLRRKAVQPLLAMLFAGGRSDASHEAARALSCFASHAGGLAVRHWLRWCQSRRVKPLRPAGGAAADADAAAAEPTTTAEKEQREAAAALPAYVGELLRREALAEAARERWLLVRFGSWLQQDARMAAYAVLHAVSEVQAWHFRLLGVYIGETKEAAEYGGPSRTPPPPPPLPPPPPERPRKPRIGVEPQRRAQYLRDGMKVLLRRGGSAAAFEANQRACLAAAFVGLLRGSEVALREEARWDPAVHLTRADLRFADGGTEAARAIVMTRPVRRAAVPKVKADYRTPHLTAADLNVREMPKGRLWAAPSEWEPQSDLAHAARPPTPRAAELDFGETPLCFNEAALEKSVPVELPAGGLLLDPYKELRALVEADPIADDLKPYTPLFRDPRTGGPLSVPQLRDLVRTVMAAAGRYTEASDYGAHSLRVGGASMMVYGGADPVDVRALGRCTNECYELYQQAFGVEAREIARRAATHEPGPGFRSFDQVAHE